MAQYLLVLHDLDESPELIASARALAAADSAAEFVLLVPAAVLAALDSLVLPYSNPTELARRRAQRMRRKLLEAGVKLSATRLGNASPLRALEDALRFADYAAVVIAAPPHTLLHRLHRDLPCRAAARFAGVRVLHARGGSPRWSTPARGGLDSGERVGS